jgi:serine/threonine protein kinase
VQIALLGISRTAVNRELAIARNLGSLGVESMNPTMSAERWRLVKELLATALEMEPIERNAYVAQVSSGDSSLREELERHLAAHNEAGTEFLRVPAPFRHDGVPTLSRSLTGLRVGAYVIVEEIGAGGMGEVYRAYRADDEYRMEVAIKLVRTGRDSDSVIRRFRNERQILASLEHPNIARLLDGGTIADGSPYFVMELIAGQPIDEYCDDHRLTVSERLKLFLPVCTAVQYAHQHLIIHRDIKPNNILVTHEGVPKLLDFGIAKILDPAAADVQLEPTQTIVRALTPGYASPEQVGGGTITTASDVYSLGVVLYELLTGRSPYRLTRGTPEEISRLVCDVEPEKPSTAVCKIQRKQDARDPPASTSAETAATRQVSPGKLKKLLEGDLDNIVLMALRKERQRRYGSVEQLARDIESHLERLPVRARKDTVGYRTSKFISRHRAGVAGAVAFLGVILLALTVTLREAKIAQQQATIAQAQRARAERHFSDLRELSNSLMFDVHDAIKDLPGSTTARKILIDKSLKYLDRLALDAGNDPSLKRELAVGYERVATVQGYPFGPNLGDTQGSTESFRKAAAIWNSLAQAHPSDIDNLLGLAGNYRQLGGMLANGGGGDPLEAMENAIKSADLMRAFASSDPRVAEELEHDYEMTAQIQCRTGGDPEAALENLGKAQKVAEQRLTENPQDQKMRYRRFRIYVLTGDTLADLGRRKQGLEQFRLGFGMFGSDLEAASMHRIKGLTLSHHGDILMMNGDFGAALQDYRHEQSLLEPLAAGDPRNTQARVELAAAYGHVGHALAALGRKSEALAMFQRESRLVQPLVSNLLQTEARADLARVHMWTGELLTAMGNPSEALDNFDKSAAGFVADLSVLPWDRFTMLRLAEAHAKTGGVLASMDRGNEAAAEYVNALGIAGPLASSNPRNPLCWYVIADAHFGLGELSKTAARKSAAALEKREHWSEARESYRQAVEAWGHITNPGIVTSAGFRARDPKEATRAFSVCEANLTRLTASRQH